MEWKHSEIGFHAHVSIWQRCLSLAIVCLSHFATSLPKAFRFLFVQSTLVCFFFAALLCFLNVFSHSPYLRYFVLLNQLRSVPRKIKLHDNALILSYCNNTNICASISTKALFNRSRTATHTRRRRRKNRPNCVHYVGWKRKKKDAKKLEKSHEMTEWLKDREKESTKKKCRERGREREIFAVDRSVITLPWSSHHRYNHLQLHFQVHLTQLIFIRSILWTHKHTYEYKMKRSIP